MANYSTKKLGEVCDVFADGDWVETKDQSSDGIRLIQTGNIGVGVFVGKESSRARFVSEATFKRLNCTEVFPGDILISRLPDPVGRACVIPDLQSRMITAVDCTVVRLNPKELLSGFFILYTNSQNYFEQIDALLTGTTRRRISRGNLAKIEIPLPPITEQRRIVAKIEKQFEKIDEAARLRAESAELAAKLLPSALHEVFSSPHNTHPYKLENVGMSSAGRNDWQEKELGEICKVNPKKAEIKDKPDNLPVSFVPMSAVDEFSQEIVSFDEKMLGEVRKGYTYFRDRDVLFAKITPCMENGKVAIARNLKNGIGFGTTEFHVIRPKDGVLSEWIYAIVRGPEFRDIARTKMTGSAGQKRVPVQFLETYKIPLPPIAEQRTIVKKLDALSEKVRILRTLQSSQSADLKSLKQSILHQAFSARI